MKKLYNKPSVLMVKVKLHPLLILSEKGNAVNDTGTEIQVSPSGVKSGGNAMEAAARSYNVWGDDENEDGGGEW